MGNEYVEGVREWIREWIREWVREWSGYGL